MLNMRNMYILYNRRDKHNTQYRYNMTKTHNINKHCKMCECTNPTSDRPCRAQFNFSCDWPGDHQTVTASRQTALFMINTEMLRKQYLVIYSIKMVTILHVMQTQQQ